MQLNGKNVTKVIYVRNTRAGFLVNIIKRLKTVETRTPRSWRMMDAAGIAVGDTVALAEKGRARATARITGTVWYATREDFRADYLRHLVPEGSAFDWVEGKGKVGIILEDVVELQDQPTLPKARRPSGFMILA